MHWLSFLFIGLIAGWLAGRMMKGEGFGFFGDIVVGVIGSFVGGFLFRSLGIYTSGGWIGSLITATLGAVVFLYVLHLIKRA
ncbi:MAG: GlsB/YeaQ/YmgE family stress response membrane protein [Methylococcaceae bacterium]|nr:GlsB/YeaQ/YmgE family stress response membrane protein [Methylococcaceae bacterium]